MERKIKKFFLDKKDQIYFLDEKNILYLYISGIFFPFLDIIKDIKNCFKIDDQYYVHHSNTISIFDENLCKINFPDNKWITRTIHDVCYHEDLDIIVTLENGKVYVNLNISDRPYYEDNTVKRLCLSTNLHFNQSRFDKIKIINELLLTYDNNKMNIYYLNFNSVKNIGSFILDKNIFSSINGFNRKYNIFRLENGDYVNFLGEYLFQNYFGNVIDTLFNEHKIFFSVKDEYLTCFYPKDQYNLLVKPLIEKLPIVEVSTTDDNNTINSTIYVLPKDFNLVINTGTDYQIINCDEKYYLVNNVIKEINFGDEFICFPELDKFYNKSEIKFVIDIDISLPIIDQLIGIIPAIYRLNNEMIYCFEQISSDGKIISFGDGVTRHVFSTLRKEIDQLLENNFSSKNKIECFKIGKLLYFCNMDGEETFFNICPYFFYSLSNYGAGNIDHLTLLKKFKSENFESLHKQYISYYNYPEKLEELDMDMKTVNDFIKFLFSSNLTDEQIELYDEFVRGYYYYSHRGKYHHLIKNLPVMNHIQKLVNLGYFNAELIFSTNGHVSTNDFIQFCEIFKKNFKQLSSNKKSFFVQNITGNNYYYGPIEIIYAYENKKIFSDGDGTSIIENNDLNKQINYEISTCNSVIIVKIDPTEDCIQNLIKILTIEDMNIKN